MAVGKIFDIAMVKATKMTNLGFELAKIVIFFTIVIMFWGTLRQGVGLCDWLQKIQMF